MTLLLFTVDGETATAFLWKMVSINGEIWEIAENNILPLCIKLYMDTCTLGLKYVNM